MNPRPVVILIDADDERRDLLALVLEHEADVQVEAFAGGEHGLDAARRQRTDLIIAELSLLAANDFRLCRQIKADPEAAGALLLAFNPPNDPIDPIARSRALQLGADDMLDSLQEPAELASRAQAMIGTKRVHQQVAADRAAVTREYAELARTVDQMMALLTHLVELAVPGSGKRGQQLAEAALRLAARFEIPQIYLRDLELAASLHEIGLLPGVHHGGSMAPPRSDWRYVMVSRSVLREVDRLRPVAELIEAMYENWDGSGHPGHLQRGQIPLRSRLLRTLTDYFAELSGPNGGSPERAIAVLALRSGTLYDPAVVAQLHASIANLPVAVGQPSRVHVPVDGLVEGMVLAEDLHTVSGVKLLAAGARLSDRTMSVLRRRHLDDPVIDGPWVLPTGAP